MPSWGEHYFPPQTVSLDVVKGARGQPWASDETAEVLGVSTATVKNRSAYAQAWLVREIKRDGGDVELP